MINRTLMTRRFTQVMAWTGVAVLCAVVAVAQDASAPADQSQGQPAAQQGPRTDGQVEMDVVHALDASAALKNDLITAATIQGEVTLSGTVSSDASKLLAESIVSHVNGVTKVHNNLQVGNPSQAAQNAQPAPDMQAQDMPDNQQPEATPGLPPPGPSPDQNPAQGQSQAPAPYPQQAPNPQQGGYPQPPPARPQYQSPQYSQYPPQYQRAPSAPSYQPASGPVTIPQGTLLYLRTSEPVDSKRAKDGEPVQFTVIQDVTSGGVLAIPRGATVHGVVTDARNVGQGKLAGSSELALTLTSLDLGGRSYPLSSDEFKVKGPNKAGETVGNAVGAGLIGTIIGCAVGRGAGCAIGAGAGVAAGTAASAASSGPRVWIPAEALVKFHVTAPVTVDPVNPQEAARLAEGLYPGGPSLYRRGPYGPRYYAGYAPYPYAYPYGYPPVYYRPYFVVGGAYYWR
ncbi:putative Transport-associated protein [Candidatus Sulfotelmatomonas gaucii]|uniref:Putative Transport-associated protein n=1 Tax=Candidatus Sulfuritelmatomonas gaucii TaxID=2043161 RepID=A0A2N9LNV2_9BACT|nr:putative Transport-associated protein [Candidatus Sulfotelmatomonas gaucii]